MTDIVDELLLSRCMACKPDDETKCGPCDRATRAAQELKALRELLAEIEWLPDYEYDQTTEDGGLIGYSAYEPPHRIKRLMELTKRN